MDRSEATIISRRAFLAGGALAIGSMFLPRVPGTEDSFLMPFYPESAWADELGASARIMVVGRTQVGIAVGDIGTLDPEAQTIRALEGATVTLHSFYNRREVSGTTDETGKVVLDIADLAEEVSADSPDQTDSKGKKLEYCFNGSITVTREGYRDTVIPRTRIRSVTAIIAPTRVLDRTLPYLRQFSFDEWDVQYNKATFVRATSNTEQHTVSAEAWVPSGKRADLRLYVTNPDGSQKTLGTKSVRGSGEGGSTDSLTLAEMFLNPTYAKKCLAAGCTLHASLECDGTTSDVTAGLEVEDAPFVDDTSGTVAITPSNKHNLDEDLSFFDFPDSLPAPLGGSRFSIWKPSFKNVMFDFSPLGYAMFGFKLGSVSAANDGGTFDPSAWKRQTGQSASQQFERVCREQAQAIADVKAMTMATDDSDRSKGFSHDFTKDMKLSGAFKLFAQLQYERDSSEWFGNLNAAVGGVLDAAWTLQMTFGPVPVYIAFDLRAGVTAGLRLGMRTYGPSLAKLVENAIYDTKQSNACVSVNIVIGLSVGVGVADVLCAYIRGAGYVSTCIAFYQANPDVECPRLTVGTGLYAELGVQLFLFKWYGSLWEKDWPCIYDSNDNGTKAATVAELAATGDVTTDKDGNLRVDVADMSIVSNAELLATREFEAAGAVAAYAADDWEPQELEPVDLGDGNLLWSVPAGIDPDAFEAEGAGAADAAAQASASGHFIYLGNSATNSAIPEDAGVSELADDVIGGIRPTSDTLIFHDVFSDARVKTITFDGRTFMFRVATVGVGGEARTRIVYSTMSSDPSGSDAWSAPRAVEFDPAGAGVPRSQMYDYDYAVCAVNGWSKYLYLMVLSGSRPDGDATSFAAANAKTVISLVRLYNSNWEDSPLQSDTAISWVPKTKLMTSFSMPSLVAYVDEQSADRETNTCVVGACLVRAAKTAEGLLEDKAARYLVSFYAEHRRGTALSVVTNQAKLMYAGVTKLSVGPIAFEGQTRPYERASSRHVHIGLVTSYGSYIEKIQVTSPDDLSQPATISLSGVAGLSGGLGVQRLYPSGNDYEFYAIRRDEELFDQKDDAGRATTYRQDGRLYLLTFDDNGGTRYEPVGPTTSVPSELAVSKDGRYLYYVVNKEGKAEQPFTPQGDVDPSQPGDEKSYRVMALARVGGLFTKPFALCELDHPLDYVVSMTSMGATASLIASTVTDHATSKADIYDIRIPLVVCGTPTSLATEGAFAFAGEDTVFDVGVRNDGNTILSGAMFNLYDEQTQKVVAGTHVSFDASAVALSADAPEAGPDYELDALSAELTASPLASSGAGGLLAPGQSQTYKVAFHIPDDWASGTGEGGTSSSRTVRVTLSNLEYVDAESSVASLAADGADADEEALDWNSSNVDFDDIDWDEFLRCLIEALISYYASLEDVPEATIGIVDGASFRNVGDLFNSESSSGGGGGNGGSGSGGSGSGGGKGGPALPDTGDKSLLAQVASALGM